MFTRTAIDCMEMHPPRTCALPPQSNWLRTLTTFAEGRTGFSGFLTLLCLSLVLLCGTLQAEHVHATTPGSPDTHAACSLCVTAHLGVESVAAPLPHLAAVVVGAVEPRLPRADYPAPRNFDLYTRPPPPARP